MKQLYRIKLRGNGRVLESFVFTTLRDKQEAARVVLDNHKIPMRERYRYRIISIQLTVPDSWMDIESKGTEVN